MDMMDRIDSSKPLKKNGDIPKNTGISDTRKNSAGTDNETDISIEENSAVYSETTVSVQREIIKEQIILAGLHTVSSFIGSGAGTGENSAFLPEIIEKTRFDNEKVLEAYYQPLNDAIINNDLPAINELVRGVEERITSLVKELEINEIKKENLLSVQSFTGGENTDAQMQKILTALKEEGLPRMDIPLKRITDLLGE